MSSIDWVGVGWMVALSESICTRMLRRNFYIKKSWEFAADAVTNWFLFGFMLLYARTPGWETISALMFCLGCINTLCWYKYRNDDDDNFRGKKFKAKLKSKIPRPVIVAIRPIQQGA